MPDNGQIDRHCTHCGSTLQHDGTKWLHEGSLELLFTAKLACEVYVCVACGHIELFQPEEDPSV